MNKAYLVMNVFEGQNGIDRSWIEKAFSTLEKSEQYKTKLEEKFKDGIKFQYKFW